jgi:predicted acylesterase/phospholipase RssA
VDVIPDKTERVEILTKNEDLKEPGIFQIMTQSIYISTYLAARTSSRRADVLLRPHVAHIGPGEFHRGSECILEGELSAVDALPEIKKLLSSNGISLRR